MSRQESRTPYPSVLNSLRAFAPAEFLFWASASLFNSGAKGADAASAVASAATTTASSNVIDLSTASLPLNPIPAVAITHPQEGSFFGPEDTIAAEIDRALYPQVKNVRVKLDLFPMYGEKRLPGQEPIVLDSNRECWVANTAEESPVVKIACSLPDISPEAPSAFRMSPDSLESKSVTVELRNSRGDILGQNTVTTGDFSLVAVGVAQPFAELRARIDGTPEDKLAILADPRVCGGTLGDIPFHAVQAEDIQLPGTAVILMTMDASGSTAGIGDLIIGVSAKGVVDLALEVDGRVNFQIAGTDFDDSGTYKLIDIKRPPEPPGQQEEWEKEWAKWIKNRKNWEPWESPKKREHPRRPQFEQWINERGESELWAQQREKWEPWILRQQSWEEEVRTAVASLRRSTGRSDINGAFVGLEKGWRQLMALDTPSHRFQVLLLLVSDFIPQGKCTGAGETMAAGERLSKAQATVVMVQAFGQQDGDTCPEGDPRSLPKQISGINTVTAKDVERLFSAEGLKYLYGGQTFKLDTDVADSATPDESAKIRATFLENARVGKKLVFQCKLNGVEVPVTTGEYVHVAEPLDEKTKIKSLLDILSNSGAPTATKLDALRVLGSKIDDGNVFERVGPSELAKTVLDALVNNVDLQIKDEIEHRWPQMLAKVEKELKREDLDDQRHKALTTLREAITQRIAKLKAPTTLENQANYLLGQMPKDDQDIFTRYILETVSTVVKINKNAFMWQQVLGLKISDMEPTLAVVESLVPLGLGDFIRDRERAPYQETKAVADRLLQQALRDYWKQASPETRAELRSSKEYQHAGPKDRLKLLKDRGRHLTTSVSETLSERSFGLIGSSLIETPDQALSGAAKASVARK